MSGARFTIKLLDGKLILATTDPVTPEEKALVWEVVKRYREGELE